MAGASHARPGRALIIVLALILGILAFYDLAGSRSTLRTLWREVFPGQTQGEELRDQLLDQFNPRR